MPFKSEKQRRWMHAKKPEMARKWEKEEGGMDEKKKERRRKLRRELSGSQVSERDLDRFSEEELQRALRKKVGSQVSEKEMAEYSDVNLKENISPGGDAIDKFVRSDVLKDLMNEMTEGEVGPMMMRISVGKTEEDRKKKKKT